MAKKAKKKKIKRRKRKKATTRFIVSSDNYEAENAADTLMRASEINDKPSLLRKAKAVLKRRQKAITKTIRQK